MKRGAYILLVGLLTSSLSSYSQTCCTGGTPLLGAYTLSSASKGEMEVHLTYNYNDNGDIISGDRKIDESFLKRDVGTLLIQFDYGISKSITVSAVVPYLFQKEVITQVNDFSFNNSGVGDISLWGQYRKSFTYLDLNVAAGFKVPTGSTNESFNGIPIPLSMQLGSGSVDFGTNVQTVFYLGKGKKWSFVNQLAIKINSKGKSFEAHSNYRFGNQFQLLGAVAYNSVAGPLLLNSFVGAIYQRREQDRFDGDFANENTGGNWVNLTVGQNVTLSPRTNLRINALFPVYRDLNGLQLSTTWQGSIGISYLIRKKNEVFDSPF